MQKYDVTQSLMRVARLLRRRPEGGHDAHHHHGHGGGRVLRVLYENNGTTAKALADRLDIRPPSLSEQLDKLEARGLVRRTRDEGDARVTRIWITDAGMAEMAQQKKARGVLDQKIDRALTEAEKEQFCALCGKLARALEEEES